MIDYLRSQRHILLDMHVPDFDDRFLRNFDPVGNVELYARAGADSVMVYCNSMVGLTYWPTNVGEMHPGLDGRDVVGETVELLREHGITACAYYSLNYNNWAYEQNPAWRVEPADPPGKAFLGESSRFGVCCPASGGFRQFACAQVEEIAQTYAFDAFFFDMVAWPGVCVCRNCRDRYREEAAGAEIPEVLDWSSSEWCTFQAARERWLVQQHTELVDAVKRHRAIPVFQNNAGIFSGWRTGMSLTLAASSDLLGGDEQDSRLFTYGHFGSRLSSSVFQYMRSGSHYVSGAARLSSAEEQQRHAFLATLFGGQFMAIDAVLPDGSVHAPTYDRLAEVFAAIKPYEEFLGGQPVADIAVYYSPCAQVNFADNGTHIDALSRSIQDEFFSPVGHGKAVLGACAALQRAHLPVGVITRADLGDLDALPVVVLPNVLRMDDEEIAAFRGYVERGGRLYASGYTSLVSTEGIEHTDFELADVFGCHFEQVEPAAVSYIRPARDDTRTAIAPTAVVPHGPMGAFFPPSEPGPTTVLVNANSNAVSLATLTRPYGSGRGSRTDRGWAAISTSPPWEDTDRPVILEHAYGAGRVIYSGCDIESSATETPAAEQLFVALVRRLLARPPRFEADTHPNVWLVAFDEPEKRRTRVNLLNHQPDGPVLPVPQVSLRLTPPEGGAFTGLCRLPGGEPVDFELDDDGRLCAEIRDLHLFDMLAAAHRTEK